MAGEQEPELQEEVVKLQTALAELQVNTAQREQQEKDIREELSEKLQQAKGLLKRAEAELRERDTKAMAYKGHLQSARAEVHALSKQRDYLKDEVDKMHRELKHAYKLQGEPEREMHPIEFPSTSKDFDPPGQEFPVQGGVALRELDKLARNIPTFTPNPMGGHDVHAYLQDIDFHLQTLTNVTTRDKLYLLRITSSREVWSFLDRQPETVTANYQQLRQALIKEFSEPDSEHGLFAAMDLKQGKVETPQASYNKLRRAYFGARNEPGMEEDFNFKTLFLQNLHSSVSQHLGVLVCPRSMSTQQLRDLAHKAYTKQSTVPEKAVKGPTIYSISEHSSELALGHPTPPQQPACS
ncbi:uncharacterized protein LOC131355645 [Hemibagrus wyckioides]|uniref:uncharacterized protein LOC131355645 n=1 Tax=Hemibagrus wyckioides TaxID=337641 RepID=UPI00266B8DDE|nr:uncharacterized protein LOC131355645 [Hemibagrus wyckioides]